MSKYVIRSGFVGMPKGCENFTELFVINSTLDSSEISYDAVVEALETTKEAYNATIYECFTHGKNGCMTYQSLTNGKNITRINIQAFAMLSFFYEIEEVPE